MFNRIRKLICKILFKFSKKNVFYITGPELLPPPLSNEEEHEAIEKMKTDQIHKEFIRDLYIFLH